MEKVVSVIIPVYNVEKYLDQCLESVVNQTYRNLEIILVDDGSPDNCPQMCDQWAEKDQRIKVVHQKNGGLSRARNSGLDISTGEYVVFVDSDDEVHPDYVDYLYQLIVAHNVQVSICGLEVTISEEGFIHDVAADQRVEVLDQNRALEELCDGRELSNSVCAKMFPRELFENVRFPNGRIYEDLATTYKLFLKAQKVAFGHRVLYKYIRRQGSVTKSAFTRRNLDLVVYAEEMCEQILLRQPDLLPITSKRLFMSYAACWKNIVVSTEPVADAGVLVDELYKKMKGVRKHIRKKCVSTREKVYYFCSWFGKIGLRAVFFLEKILRQ